MGSPRETCLPLRSAHTAQSRSSQRSCCALSCSLTRSLGIGSTPTLPALPASGSGCPASGSGSCAAAATTNSACAAAAAASNSVACARERMLATRDSSARTSRRATSHCLPNSMRCAVCHSAPATVYMVRHDAGFRIRNTKRGVAHGARTACTRTCLYKLKHCCRCRSRVCPPGPRQQSGGQRQEGWTERAAQRELDRADLDCCCLHLRTC